MLHPQGSAHDPDGVWVGTLGHTLSLDTRAGLLRPSFKAGPVEAPQQVLRNYGDTAAAHCQCPLLPAWVCGRAPLDRHRRRS